MQHIVKLDPTSIDSHVELAELATRLRQAKIATSAYLQAAQLLRQSGDEDRWAELVEKAHELDPADEPAAIAAAELYAKKQQPSEAVRLLEPVFNNRPDDLAVVQLLCQGYLATEEYAKAQPLCWKLHLAKPEAVELLLQLMEGFLQIGQSAQALEVVSKLKERLSEQGKKTEFLVIMEKIYATDESNLEVLEILTDLHNEMNNEDGLRRSLTRLFGLYLAAEQYNKAADALERILDVDPYGEGHNDRLVNLEGHIDPIWYKNIHDRLQPPSTSRVPLGTGIGAGAGAATKGDTLEDLLVEGEMFYQYQLSTKLRETLEKINRLFPGAEEQNDRLRELYEAAGFTPKFTATAAAPPPAPGPDKAEIARAQAAASAQSLEDLRRISEITADIYRESTPQAVMQVAVNQLGRALKVSRGWGALGALDRPPALTAEYSSSGAHRSNTTAAIKLYAVLMRQALSSPDGWSVKDLSQVPLLAPIRPDIQTLGTKSLLALPLLDRDEPTGLLVMEQCDDFRSWTTSEVLLVKAIATQVVIAVNNTKLRRLVRSLAGTDPETGLLPRSAYLDCMLAEARRAKDQSQPLAVCLIEPENPTAFIKTLGEPGVQRFIQQVSKSLLSALRQNDIAVRYNPLSIAVVFPDTALPQAGLTVEKVRRVLAQVRVDGTTAPYFCAAVCDVPLGSRFDAVDGVTEVINRLELSIEQCRKEGRKRVLMSKSEG